MAGTDPRDGRFASGISGPGTTLAANRLVLLAAVPLFLILALCAYLTIQFAANEREAQGWVRHTYQVIEQLDLVLSDALDAETGQRGFLLTRKPEFLGPYQTGRGRVTADLSTFRQMTRDNPSE
jgi:CHASE3 domain sensor protein